MPKRRANGEGNIRKRKDGRWEGRYTAGYDQTGKRIIKNVLGKTQAEVVVRGVHTLLHNCLEQAVAERLILTNPAQGCKLPQLEKKEMKILPQEKIGMYLAEAEKRGLLAAF